MIVQGLSLGIIGCVGTVVQSHSILMRPQRIVTVTFAASAAASAAAESLDPALPIVNVGNCL